ncbi:hypothetical protein BP5796_12405 [Coleophoma crateriformis]|uniref:NAD(P)-binding protein n=1 Tax=Coleophoma crateriformis TaxID=565419 RepID=A0A3D8Q9F5_9HELO|nr:hypothetical protein BP5796_12405 [Coleophoma crateriformis]
MRGYLPDAQPISEADVEEWSRGMTINVKGNLIVAKYFLKYSSEKPTFVHVSAGGGHMPPLPSHSSYAVSKLAAAKMMEYLAAESPHVRVHTLHPGLIDTDMSKKGTSGVELPASFVIWLISPEGEFLKNKFVWSNWDVEELKAKRNHYSTTLDLTVGLLGWP